MKPNFTACGEYYLKHTDLFPQYAYTGAVKGLPGQTTARPPLITAEGCKALCGSSSEYYAWKAISQTITTWVLPGIGLLLQLPYESNAFWRTAFAMARWTGNPIATFSYTFWNIKVTSKSALMIDMATKYEDLPGPDSPFAQVRDSLYILTVMNQYSIKEIMPTREAERLLRIALFSDVLPLNKSGTRTLPKRRQKLATTCREGRKKGIIPVYISLFWFLSSLAFSIQAAFYDVGDNATAHNLALGLMLCWLPVLILVSIVDRNNTITDTIQSKMNILLEEVRQALVDPERRDEWMRRTKRIPEELAWTASLANEELWGGGFFTEYAGQGRERWHYGVAHPILTGIETSFVAEYGRDWLRDKPLVTAAMVLGPTNERGLRVSDWRMVWQVLAGFTLVVGTIAGAFVLSFYTPTIGLSCRSYGYLIFVVLALLIFTLEMIIWFLMDKGWISSGRTKLKASEHGYWIEHKLEENQASDPRSTGQSKAPTGLLRRLIHWWRNTTGAARIDVLLLRPLEVVNFVWLLYIVFAQTVGAYQTCDCFSAIWVGQGRYVDFSIVSYYSSHTIEVYWSVATAVTCAVMCAGFAYIVAEYCTQAHISTDHYGRAMHGMMMTRRYKKYTRRIRTLIHDGLDAVTLGWRTIRGHHVRPGRKSLRWDWRTRDRAELHRLLEQWTSPPRMDDLGTGQPMGGSLLKRNVTASTTVEVPSTAAIERSPVSETNPR